jgi:Flp pilus assembly pilin Flp
MYVLLIMISIVVITLSILVKETVSTIFESSQQFESGMCNVQRV